MHEFEQRYAALNSGQKQAVDTIDGPVMVVAGPGTGKTELLSVRVANILRTTDTLPGNILCLTFTDSGAVAMRERLAGLLGPEAYKVAIHTFHSFGSEIINQHGEYFYNGAHFRPADELSSYEVLSGLLEKLSHGNPLASTMNGEYTYLKDIQSSISELKRAGLTPDELTKILELNDTFIRWAQPKLQTAFGDRLSKKTLPLVETLLSELEEYAHESYDLIGYTPLSVLVATSLRQAYDDAVTEDSTKPLSAWKRTYLEKNGAGEQTLKDERRASKLQALAGVYFDYLVAMQEQALYDYDDMILRVVHALEVFDELRFNLQETYHYILVDEFQDTNDAQMRLVWNLTNNPAQEGRPNLLVVGDDDQAIYRFQGATMSNILDFRTRYRDVKIITLKDNYRSQAAILSLARAVIVQGEERLETTVPNLDKTLTPHRKSEVAFVEAHQYETAAESHYELARTIAAHVQESPTATRAIIARNHRQLTALLPHLEHFHVPLRYERQENVFDSEPIQQLELVARTVHSLRHDAFAEADESLSQLLAHPAWSVAPVELWKVSLEASRERQTWLETLQERGDRLGEIANWLITMAQTAKNQPLEYVLDCLFGTDTAQLPDTVESADIDESSIQTETFVSPLYSYFFNQQEFDENTSRYTQYLSNLQKIRAALREYRPDQTLTLCDFIAFIDLHRDLGLTLQGAGDVETGANPLVLLSAHKAKGLEFDSVYITDVQENIWGSSARSRSRLLSFPSNLPISPAGDSDDERLRLLYVALTRARDQLTLLSARQNENGKQLLPVGSIAPNMIEMQSHGALDLENAAETARIDWQAPLFTVPHADQKQLLKPLLERYKLSATHLNNFLDIPRGGPELFLLHNLLRFPQAMSPSAAYGSAIHLVLQRAHQHLAAKGERKPIEDVVHEFESLLNEYQLSSLDMTKYTERGVATLSAFLTARYDSFTPTQRVEQNFSGEAIQIGEATLTGAIDLLDVDDDEKTVFVTDYKTGKAVPSWRGRTPYEKIKLHHYEQQLLFYKLLIEHSRQFAGYTATGARIEFVEPDDNGTIVLLDYDYEREQLATFERLVGAVWRHIMQLDFTTPHDYDPTLDGIRAFEDYLLG
jgi:DNA helicase-2/ATP-dependent DNA helicase PcrA